MTTCLLTTAYWPPVQAFCKMAGAATLVLEQHEHYVKQTYRNRCLIYSANGVLPLTVPVAKTPGVKMPIRDVRIDYSEPWQRMHWRAIEAAYRSSAFFAYYADDFRPFYERKEKFLFDLNEQILRLALDLAGLKITITYTGKFEAGNLTSVTAHDECRDERYRITPKLPFPDDKKFKPQHYYQVFSSRNGFAANLSVLDLLCNEGNNSLAVLQQSTVRTGRPSSM
ncbi:MAG: WbqC family protein [Prevotellaceae bacterium]|jgi:hypothetical protein|nr:WbqC family protein [Prevotellaceae bacterium]